MVTKIHDLKKVGTKEAMEEAAKLTDELKKSGQVDILTEMAEAQASAIAKHDPSHVAAHHRVGHHILGNTDEVANLTKTGIDAQENMLSQLTGNQLLKGLDEAIANKGFLDAEGNHIGAVLSGSEIKSLAQLRKAFTGVGKKVLEDNLLSTMGKQFDRKMGLGLPILGDFFNWASIDVSKRLIKDQKGWICQNKANIRLWGDCLS